MSQLFTSGDQSSFYNNIIFCREENLNVMKPRLSVISFMSCAFGIVFKLHLGLPSILSQVLWVVLRSVSRCNIFVYDPQLY